MGVAKKRAMSETVGDGSKIKAILGEIFTLMDDDSNGKIDESEGVAIGMAMGETREQAKKSWTAMVKDMDDEATKDGEIELSEWESFYIKSLKDAPLEDVLSMLTQMKESIAENKDKK